MVLLKNFKILDLCEPGGKRRSIFDWIDADREILRRQGFLIHRLVNYPNIEDVMLRKLLEGLDNTILSDYCGNKEFTRNFSVGTTTGRVPLFPTYTQKKKVTQSMVKDLFPGEPIKVPLNLFDAFKLQCSRFGLDDDITKVCSMKDATDYFNQHLNRLDRLEPGESLSSLYLIIEEAVKIRNELESLGFDVDRLETDMLRLRFGDNQNGITSSWFYLALHCSIFPLHNEDAHGTNSFNVCLAGSGVKFWIIVPPSQNEKLLQGLREWDALHNLDGAVGDDNEPNILAYKTRFVSPRLMDQLGVDYYIFPQLPGYCVTTASFAFHEGINVGGFLVNKAINFAGREFFENIYRFPLNYQRKQLIVNGRRDGLILSKADAEQFVSLWNRREKTVRRLLWNLKEADRELYVMDGDEIFNQRAYKLYCDRNTAILNNMKGIEKQVSNFHSADADAERVRNYFLELLQGEENMRQAAYRVLTGSWRKWSKDSNLTKKRRSLLSNLNRFVKRSFDSSLYSKLVKEHPEIAYRLFKETATSSPDKLSLASKLVYLRAAWSTGRGDRIIPVLKSLAKDDGAKEEYAQLLTTHRRHFPVAYLELILEEMQDDVTQNVVSLLEELHPLRYLMDKNLLPSSLYGSIRREWEERGGAAEALDLVFTRPEFRESDPLIPETRRKDRESELDDLQTEAHHHEFPDQKDKWACSCDPSHFFTSRANLVRHIREQLGKFDFGRECWLCVMKNYDNRPTYARKEYYLRHYRVDHLKEKFVCPACGVGCCSSSGLSRHMRRKHVVKVKVPVGNRKSVKELTKNPQRGTDGIRPKKKKK